MKKSQLLAAFGIAVVPSLGFLACKKDEPPPPMPAATETTAPPPAMVAPIASIPDDAGDDADADAKKVVGGKPLDVTGLRACCAGLSADAASMPPPNNAYAAAAAQYCTAAVAGVNTPGQKDAFLAAVRGMMHGSSVPAQCH